MRAVRVTRRSRPASAGAAGGAHRNCVAKQSCASPDVTNEPDLSGLRVGPDQSNTVPKEGLEPSHPKAQEPKSCVSTNSTTPASWIASLASLVRRGSRLEPAYFVVARRRKACRLAPPQHGGARSGIRMSRFAWRGGQFYRCRSRLSLSTWPVAFTLYWATAIVPLPF
jgi:hypothetical protein